MLTILCPAKVNLFLAIQGKDENGYHLLDTVFMRTMLLSDALTIERADSFSFECDTLPAEGNSVVKAVELFEKHVGKKQRYRVRLEKKIPAGSGLGGASSDAAAMLKKLSELGGYDLPHETLMRLGAEVGMDVPFFLSGYSMAHGTHYGEQLELLPPLPKEIQLRIELGSIHSSTKEAFQKWDDSGLVSTKTSHDFIAALKSGDSAAILKNLHNDFEFIYPNKPALKSNEVAVLTGSGSAHAVLLLM